MLLRRETLEGVHRGEIRLAFRRWKRPTVRSGGTLKTALGELEIVSVERVARGRIRAADARAAGFPTRAALLEELDGRGDGELYRIELGRLGADPRVALRARRATKAELSELRSRLERMDGRAAGGPWTARVLELLAREPGVRAADLCARVGQEKDVFKRNVRKLKSLGLTESLEVGYRLSPRGRALLESLGR